MHERTQRQVCRVVYVLACLVPTVLTIGGVLYFHRPWQEQDWQRLLENKLHVRVSISQVAAPRPGERQLFEVHLADLQSSDRFAFIDKLNLLSDDSLHAERIELTFPELNRLAKTVQVWLSADELPAFSFKAGKLLLSRSAEETCELSDIQIAIENPTTQKRRLSFQANLLTTEAKPARMRLQIERSPTGTWDVSLDCRECQLPAWLFADFLPGAGRWKAAQITGTLQLKSIEGSLDGTLVGTIAPIDMQTWLGKDSPHKLRATASLQFDKLTWHNHCITEAQGSLESEPGQISRSLTTALTKSLCCTADEKLTDPSSAEVLSFERLGCKFTMNATGLTILGNSTEMQGCILAGNGQPLLLQPTYSNLPLPYFVQVFCPLEKYWLPGMRKAADLAEVLPMPEEESLRK